MLQYQLKHQNPRIQIPDQKSSQSETYKTLTNRRCMPINDKTRKEDQMYLG